MKYFILFGDHNFPLEYFLPYKDHHFILIESRDLQEKYFYHKLRIAYLFSTQRHTAWLLKENDFQFTHLKITDRSELTTYIDRLDSVLKNKHITAVQSFFKEDHFFRKQIETYFFDKKIAYQSIVSPLFINPLEDFKQYLSETKKPFLKTFYELSRKKYRILVDKKLKPVGDKWSFDEDNRKPYKGDPALPPTFSAPFDEIDRQAIEDVLAFFPTHPGSNQFDELKSAFIFPRTRAMALKALDHFLKYKLYHFGTYEDAITSTDPFLFHSLLSPLLNVGLLLPTEVIKSTLKYSEKNSQHLPSTEGFIRQILGWREFVRGLYHFKYQDDVKVNFFQHQRDFNQRWYDANTGIVPLDRALKKLNQYAYTHHIERLMLVSNIMLLLGIHPKRVHYFFSQMYIDSMDWVMAANVYGMGQFSDGGLFATKPYICGSNYILKMSDEKKGDWCEDMDALYWNFIITHYTFFKSQPRLSMMAAMVDKMDPQKKEKITLRACKIITELTQ